jgi:ATP-dependent DNA helicase
MPEIFAQYSSFESWFDFSALKDKNSYDQIFNKERQQGLITSLHAILKPFLLRRVKADVEKSLPKKREYVLFAPLTHLQQDLYKSILNKTPKAFLEAQLVTTHLSPGLLTPTSLRSPSVGSKRKSAHSSRTTSPNKTPKTTRDSTPAGRGRRTTKQKDYTELTDSAYFSAIDRSPSRDDITSDSDEDTNAMTKLEHFAKKQISQKKLQNPTMQLRLCCNSPFNFYNPFIHPDGTESDPDETLVTSSGKMLVLDALLPKLFNGNNKVLIFSQFKTQLDLIESFAAMRGWECCRIDGGVAQTERAEQIEAFNDPAGTHNLFLLSTRAGGQGINLTAANTVILFDSDWNPQQDLQAQDRAHRIGQKQNVLVFRLATRNTVEEHLLEEAQSKRRLEKLAISEQGLRGTQKNNDEKELIDRLRKKLARSDGQIFNIKDGSVLSDRDLAILTDRSDESYARAERGEDKGDAFATVEMTAAGLLEGFDN